MTELYEALLKAKRHISPPAKNRKAMYGKYADLESVLGSVERPLADEGLVLSQSGVTVDGQPMLRTSLVHVKTGQVISSDIPLVSKNMNDPQQLGGSITYARRYGITALLSIVADDDDDGNTSAGKQADGKPKKKEPEVKPEQVQEALAVEQNIPNKLVDALIVEYQRAGFDKDREMIAEIRAVVGRDFKQLAELTEAEARAAAGHARKVKRGDAERLASKPKLSGTAQAVSDQGETWGAYDGA